MTVVFVPGACETGVVFGDLSRVLRTDWVTVEFPGFGAPLPDDATVSAQYLVDILIEKIEGLRTGKVDLIGHEWGGVIAARVAVVRPDLVSSWVSDYVAPLCVDYAWSEPYLASLLSTDVGEEFFAGWLAKGQSYVATTFRALGLGPAMANSVASSLDAQMVRSTLDLYRSARDLPATWGRDFVNVARPGLIIGPQQSFRIDPKWAAIGARQSGARLFEDFDGGYFWMVGDVRARARLLEDFFEQSKFFDDIVEWIGS